MRYSIFSVVAILTFGITSAYGSEGNTASRDARCTPKACFPSSVVREGNPLTLQGISVFEWFFIDVYSAAFYSTRPVNAIDDVFDSQPKYLVLKYHHGIKKKDFCRSTKEIMENNPRYQEDVHSIARKLDALCTAYEDVSPGETYALYSSGPEKIYLLKNGQVVFSETGSLFQELMFGIWLSQFSVDRDFTLALLGKE